MTLLAVLAAFAAVWCWQWPAPERRLHAAEPTHGRSRLGWVRRLGPPVAVVAVTVAGYLGWAAPGAAVAFASALPVATLGLLWQRQRRQSAAVRAADQVAGTCQQLAGLLRVGHIPGSALRVAARDSPVLAAAAATQEVGGDVAGVLNQLAGQPGRAGLAQLAAAWTVSEQTGASLTATLDALAYRLTAERKLRGVVTAELSAARATGRLLAVLPLAGIALGYGVGGDPLGFLTGSLPGQLCLAAGSALGCAGVLWTEQIAAAAET